MQRKGSGKPRAILLALAPYAHLRSAYAASVPCEARFLQLLLSRLGPESVASVLAPLEDHLRVLLTRRSLGDLREQCAALFGDSLREWNKGWTELTALAFLDASGALAEVGWPPGPGDSLPFDGRVVVGPSRIPFDIKPASGSGLLLLELELEQPLDAWRHRRKLKSAVLVIRAVGLLTQEVVGKHLPRVRKEFERYLSEIEDIPAVAWTTRVDSTSLEIAIRASRSSLGSGVASVMHHVDETAATILRHARAKLKNARKTLEPFLLLYVAPFGTGGADLRSSLWEPAVRAASKLALCESQQELWLGAVSLSFAAGAPESLVLLRTGSAWPVDPTTEVMGVVPTWIGDRRAAL